MERRRLHVDGTVQGVGFRPFVYTLAAHYGLTGWVQNSSAGVDIEVQGEKTSLDVLIKVLQADPPPLARVQHVRVGVIPSQAQETGFAIRESEYTDGISLIPPDTATCPACLNEIFEPSNRRYRYPFTNCTHCGPRYTIIRAMPYDRSSTTMADFGMCPDCRAEYENPLDRRFHAQPNACPACGPQVSLIIPPDLSDLIGSDWSDAIAWAAAILRGGYILAIKGLGGFHLACDATNADAVTRLRQRKTRPHKPFAVMVASLEEAKFHAEISPEEAELLSSHTTPIVLVDRNPDSKICSEVAPDSRNLGLMLAYTPLHHLLLHDAGCPLVMTSGNAPGLPIIAENNEARLKLAGIADAYLVHNRPIHTRCDDAVWTIHDNQPQPIRRARGDAPRPIQLKSDHSQHVLALGGEMKNTLCLVRDGTAFMSQHLGEIDSAEALENLKRVMAHLMQLFRIGPEVVVHDLHPAYLTSALAAELSEQWNVPRLAVQHHHAHIAACLAEHLRDDPVIGVAFDGTGYGPDHSVWGGEFLIADLAGYQRVAHLEALPLPGGEAAIRRPYRTALAYLCSTQKDIPNLPFLRHLPEGEKRVVLRQVERSVNTTMTSSCGRLFDAVAAMAGICSISSFEGQAAIALEEAARQGKFELEKPYPYEIDANGTIRLTQMLKEITSDILAENRASEIAGRFHQTLTSMISETALHLRSSSGLQTVVLSGGVFQNRLLSQLARRQLQSLGFEVLEHQQVPANDGGISLGQAAIALQRIEQP